MRQRTKLLIGATREVASELSPILAAAGLPFQIAPTDALEATLTGEVAEAVLIDLSLGDADALVDSVLANAADIPVIVIGAADEIERGIAALRRGASDMVRRPLNAQEVGFVIDKAMARADANADTPPPSRAGKSRMVGGSPPLLELLALIERAARGTATVLVRGESGTGKELVARQVHEQSPRASGPFVKVHCGALPDNLLESELFGYEKGAFTGATHDKPGRVELAEGGTLFLDEIGDISLTVQVKLLRVLQDREYERLGGTKTLSANVRFVAATHRNLEDMVRKGTFRQDLFYRLNVVKLVVPALRERREDIGPLARHFFAEACLANDRPEMQLDDEALAVMESYKWPGNVRQLQNLMERMVVLADGEHLRALQVRAELKGDTSIAPMSARAPLSDRSGAAVITVEELEMALRIAERRALQKALDRASGNRNAAARILGVSRRKLYYMLQDHELT